VKSNRRLDYATLSEVLGQRGLVEPERLNLALQASLEGGLPFPESLVAEDAIGDWELAKVVCDIYGLPFLPVDIYDPGDGAAEELDKDFLRKHRLVPVGRHGSLLVIAMPAIVEADALGALGSMYDVRILPVVGTVQTNARWLDAHAPEEEVSPALPAENGAWGNIFDEGDAAVLMDLSDDTETFEVEPLPADPIDEDVQSD